MSEEDAADLKMWQDRGYLFASDDPDGPEIPEIPDETDRWIACAHPAEVRQ